MPDRLVEKTERYEELLAEALTAASINANGSAEETALAREHLTMAESYLEDGRHFLAEDDHVTALAAFSYGHGWLDAAARSDLLAVPRETDLFAI